MVLRKYPALGRRRRGVGSEDGRKAQRWDQARSAREGSCEDRLAAPAGRPPVPPYLVALTLEFTEAVPGLFQWVLACRFHLLAHDNAFSFKRTITFSHFHFFKKGFPVLAHTSD